MRLAAKFRIDPEPLEALRASLRFWLVGALAWLMQALARHRAPAWARNIIAAGQRQLDADLRETARDLRMLLLAHAWRRMQAPATPAFTRTPRLSDLRFIRQRNSFLRKATCAALKGLHAGGLRQRAERLRDLFDHFGPLIEAVTAHLARLFTDPRLPQLRLVAIADALAFAPAHASACADTS